MSLTPKKKKVKRKAKEKKVLKSEYQASVPLLARLLPEMEKMIDESEKEGREIAAYVLRDKDNNYVMGNSVTGSGEEVNINNLDTGKKQPISLFHTHPTMSEGGWEEDEIEIFINRVGDKGYSRRAARKGLTPSTMDIVYPILREEVVGDKKPQILCIGNKEGIVCYRYKISPESKLWIEKFLKRVEKHGHYYALEELEKKSLPYRDMYLSKEIWLRTRKRK